MSSDADDDEFDDFFKDDLADVDWDAIPAMSQHPQGQAPAAATLVPAPAAVVDSDSDSSHPPPDSSQCSTITVTQQPVATPSSDDYGLEELDESFLGEVDALERALTQGTGPAEGSNARDQTAGALLTSIQSTGFHTAPPQPDPVQLQPESSTTKEDPQQNHDHADSSSSSRKRPRTESSSSGSATPTTASGRKKKGKKRERYMHEGVKKVLEGFEDELSCPICCDIFACAHLGNPCGHSYCGECGYDWVRKNVSKHMQPTCSICRASLSVTAPIIPNFALDSTIEKHVQALAASGVEEWRDTGARYKEWQARKERWKAGAAQREAETKAASLIDLTADGADTTSDSGSSDEDTPNEDEVLLFHLPGIFAPSAPARGRGRGRGGGRGNGRGRGRSH